MILIAILLPWLSFLLRGKIVAGIICLVLQVTLIGWLPAMLWAVISRSNERSERSIEKLLTVNGKRN